tara:strand:- start:213 stop:992 length:780 start_codon:yes stop_codon:yes gene_type:complete
MKHLDKLADLNLKLICQSKSKSIYDVRFLDLDGVTELWSLGNNQHKQLAKYLEKNKLIERNGENCILKIESEKICKNGWIEYLKSKNDDNIVLKMNENTISRLQKIMDGHSFTMTKDRAGEIKELILKLNNLGIIKKVNGFEYVVEFEKRKHLSKLIEIGSWDNFLIWLNAQSTNHVTTNNFTNSKIGTLIQDTSLSNSNIETTISAIPNSQPVQKSIANKAWDLISNNKLITSIIILGIEEVAWGKIWKWVMDLISRF